MGEGVHLGHWVEEDYRVSSLPHLSVLFSDNLHINFLAACSTVPPCFSTTHVYHTSDTNASCFQVTQAFKERQVPEGFLVFPACQDLLAAVDPRETEEVMVTLDGLVLEWRVPGVPRVLMAPRDLQVLGSLDLRVLEAPLENKVSHFFSDNCFYLFSIIVNA